MQSILSCSTFYLRTHLSSLTRMVRWQFRAHKVWSIPIIKQRQHTSRTHVTEGTERAKAMLCMRCPTGSIEVWVAKLAKKE